MSNKNLTIIIIVLIVGISLFLYLKNKKSTTTTSSAGSTTGPSTHYTSTVSAPKTTSVSTFPLQQGSTGVEVSALQTYLNNTYNAGLVVDGNFGPATQTALNSNMGEISMSYSEYNSVVANDPNSTLFSSGDTSNTNNPDPFAGTNVGTPSSTSPSFIDTILGYF